jgi:putative colanic acid biosynthesis acetyltransferase WcaF
MTEYGMGQTGELAKIDLSKFENTWYRPGGGFLTRSLWFFIGSPIVRSTIISSSAVRTLVLRAFGARIGSGVVWKPGAHIKYPWRLAVGDHSWIGEDCWIDSLANITIGSHVCVSQGVYLCTGNHDWSDPYFALRVSPIVIEDGAWVGAKAVVCPGVTVGNMAVLTAGSVATKSLPSGEIHVGNPAVYSRKRAIRPLKQ